MVCGAAPLAIGLSLTAPAQAQSSVWDRPLSQPVQQSERSPARHSSQPYHPAGARPVAAVDPWEQAYAPVATAEAASRVARTTSTPVMPSVTRTPARRQAIVPLPESVIRAAIEPKSAEPVFSRKQTSSVWDRAASSPSADEAARWTPPGGGASQRPVPAATPNPAQVVSHSDEHAYPLFDAPDGNWFDVADASWRYRLAQYKASEEETQWLLAPVNTVATLDGQEERRVVMARDGLDAVAGEPTSTGRHHDPYTPVPLQQIRPYRNYSPDDLPLCPAESVRCPPVKELPGSLESHERYFAHLDFLWLPSNIFYSPLYFEDPALERYGHTHGPLVQPLASTSRFAVQLIGLPYQVALDPPHRRVYPLGFFRPGECAPKQVTNVPLNAKAAAASAAVYTGLIFAFP